MESSQPFEASFAVLVINYKNFFKFQVCGSLTKIWSACTWTWLDLHIIWSLIVSSFALNLNMAIELVADTSYADMWIVKVIKISHAYWKQAQVLKEC